MSEVLIIKVKPFSPQHMRREYVQALRKALRDRPAGLGRGGVAFWLEAAARWRTLGDVRAWHQCMDEVKKLRITVRALPGGCWGDPPAGGWGEQARRR